jgi:hypothetical protein
MKPTPIGRFTDTPSYEELQREVARLRLTDEEREAIRRAIFRCTLSERARRLSGMDDQDRNDAETFSGLLQRTK